MSLSFVLLLALVATAGDQLAARTLFTSSPLWAVAVCLILVWRRSAGFDREANAVPSGSRFARIALFVLAHLCIVGIGLAISRDFAANVSGTLSPGGVMLMALKFSVLLPTLVLLPCRRWRFLASSYAAEGIAGLVVLFTFFPSRALSTIWPWYGQLLGQSVFAVARVFARPLSYVASFTPTIQGPALDVTILPSCSGISGIELFDYLFAFVAVLDWNSLRKGRMLAAYFAGVAVMLAGNALRIVSFVVLGNRGFADIVSRYHLSAGWIFFSVLFLVYLSLIYGALLNTRRRNVEQAPSA